MSDKLSKQQEEQILLYATYNILYVNDIACNLAKELVPVIAQKDKESKKIFGALMKRVHQYSNMIENIVGDKIFYLADYFGEMDDIVDPIIDEFRSEVSKAYHEAGIEDCSFYAKVETMRGMFDFAKFSAQVMIEKTSVVTKRTGNLKFYVLESMAQIANNFADWTYRHIRKDVNVEFGEDSNVMKCLARLNEALMDFDNYQKSYNKAIEYEKERNNELSN